MGPTEIVGVTSGERGVAAQRDACDPTGTLVGVLVVGGEGTTGKEEEEGEEKKIGGEGDAPESEADVPSTREYCSVRKIEDDSGGRWRGGLPQ